MARPWQARTSEFHPYMVDNVDALPASLAAPAKAALPPESAQRADAGLTRALYVPRDYRARGWLAARQTPEQALIFTDAGVLYVQGQPKGEEPGSEPTNGARPPMLVRPDTLLYMRSSHLLLYGRLEFVSAVAGEAVKLDMEFNAVGWRLMDNEWRSLVGKIVDLPPLPPDALLRESEHEQELLEDLPPKFSFGLRKYGLYTGEILYGVVFQAPIWDKHWALFPKQITANTLLALTNASVIMIDEDRALVRKSQQYGYRITRIPLRAIAGLAVAEQDGLQELTFTLARNGAEAERHIKLDPQTAGQWLALWATHKK
ncbi:MAG: hypothetical protein U0X20_21050 [Caldilineaceae bacterium]